MSNMADGEKDQKKIEMNNAPLANSEETVRCSICLELLDDPRDLVCKHTFCLECLQGFQRSKSVKACPLCKMKTVPPKEEITALPKNDYACRLVGLVRKYKNEPTEPASDQETKDCKNKKWGDMSDESDEEDGAVRLRQMLERITFNRFEEFLRRGTRNRPHVESDTHNVICDHCRKSDFTCNRYKCGICNDYDLCAECFNNVLCLHDQTHLFILIKRPSNRNFQRMLDPMEAMCLATSMDLGNTEHETIQCDSCDTWPVRGRRYKCGSCLNYELCEECAERCLDIHDRTHTFIVIPFAASYVAVSSSLQERSFYT